mgnify:CR=1 FL=1
MSNTPVSDELAALCESETRGAQSVAVEERSGVHAVGKGDGGRPVPRLGKPRVVFKEPLNVLAYIKVSAPRLRHEHQHGVRKAAPRGGVEFDRVVEAGGVALPLADYGDYLLDVLPEERGLKMRLARAHLVEISAQGVDFAVVGEIAERLGQLPSWKCIGAVPLVHEGNSAPVFGVGEVWEKFAQLRRVQQPLVYYRAARERADVKGVAGRGI